MASSVNNINRGKYITQLINNKSTLKHQLINNKSTLKHQLINNDSVLKQAATDNQLDCWMNKLIKNQ